MRDRFKMAPPAMQKQAIIRGLLAFGSLLLCTIGLKLQCSFSVAALAVVVVMFFYVNFVIFLFKVIDGDYICVQGVCCSIERTAIRFRLKSFTLDLGPKKLKVIINGKPPKAKVGDKITVYISPKTTVYGDDQILMICHYHAVQVN